MADIDASSLSTEVKDAYSKLRHKYINGSGEIVLSVGGVLNDGGTFPDTSYESVVSARSSVEGFVASGGGEIVLPSAADAAKFQAGDNIQVFHWSTGASVSTDTVLAVKGQKLILSTATDAALQVGDIVVRFETAKVGGEFSSAVDASAGRPYVGAADIVEYLQAVQQNITDIVYKSSGTAVTGNASGDSSDEGQFSKFVTAVDVPEARNMEGDLITFTAAAAGALVGCTARIMSHTTGNNVTLTVGDIRDSNGVFLGDQFPVDTASTHSAGAGSALSVTSATDFTVECGVVDKFIEQIIDSSSVQPPKNAGQENSNAPEAVSVAMMALFELMSKLEPNDATNEFVTAALEEKILGHMIGGAVGTAQGKRLPLLSDAALTDASITVEMDNAINDVPFPLSGTVRVHTNRGVDNNQGAAGVVVSSDIAYTRTKRSNVLTFGSGTVDTYNSSDGEIFKAGDVVELLPSLGQIMKGHASQMSGYDLLELMEVVHRQLIDYDVATIQ